MQAAITTRYHGPTNYKSGRVKATARQRKENFPALALTQQYEHAMSPARNHADVAKRLAESLGWSGVWVAGGLPDERGNVFVNIGNGPHFLPAATEGADWFNVEEIDKIDPHNPDTNPDWKPHVAYRVYACEKCGAETTIQTNHTGSCFSRCLGKCRTILHPHTAHEKVLPAETRHVYVAEKYL